MNPSATMKRSKSGESHQSDHRGLGNAVAVLKVVDLEGVDATKAPDSLFSVKADEAVRFDVATEIHIEP